MDLILWASQIVSVRVLQLEFVTIVHFVVIELVLREVVQFDFQSSLIIDREVPPRR